MKTTILALGSLLAALFASSCGTQGYGMTNPYTNPNAPAAHRDALTGGALGAVAGYYLGKQSDRRGEGAALGAALGATAGYLVGQQKDRQWQQYHYQNQPQPYQSYPNQGPYYK
ncbi:MAG: glycine zipper domain-containing protein [Verrucomicrobiales bacterium]